MKAGLRNGHSLGIPRAIAEQIIQLQLTTFYLVLLHKKRNLLTPRKIRELLALERNSHSLT